MASTDHRLMAAALSLSERGRGRTAPNPNVGCIIVNKGRIVGRGWTQPGGRPHAEAMALAQAGTGARGGTAYVTLEPCAHVSSRGPACADLLISAGVARLVMAKGDPDERTNGAGAARLRAAGIDVEDGVMTTQARTAMAGYFCQHAHGRPHVTLKLAVSLDGCIALASGESRWITGPEARAHAHLERARADMILVGGGTLRADAPHLDVRLPGLADRSPQRAVLTRGPVPEGWHRLTSLDELSALAGIHELLVEGGAGAASAFLRADLVDRLLLYRAPILIGGGKMALGDIGLVHLADAHQRWTLASARALGKDVVETYHRIRI
jgi:diaminohydroxyphosphoribosylaminopyrimidine deaminase/5-amino-6-(5-phosphoribosylamino)uracil reductase